MNIEDFLDEYVEDNLHDQARKDFGVVEMGIRYLTIKSVKELIEDKFMFFEK